MRRAIAGVVMVGLAAALTTDASLGSTTRYAPGWRIVPVTAWSLTDVGVGARSLVITYELGSGSCDRPAPPRVMESGTAIRIRVRKQEYVGPGSCTADDRIGRSRIQLRQRVAGRRVLQPREGAPFAYVGPYGPNGQPIIPRVIGLNPKDAWRLVLNDGLHPRFSDNNNPPDPGSVVIDQSPKPHTLRRARTVTIFTVAADAPPRKVP